MKKEYAFYIKRTDNTVSLISTNMCKNPAKTLDYKILLKSISEAGIKSVGYMYLADYKKKYLDGN